MPSKREKRRVNSDPSAAAHGFEGMARARSTDGVAVDWAAVDPTAVASLEMALTLGVTDDDFAATAERVGPELAAQREAQAALLPFVEAAGMDDARFYSCVSADASCNDESDDAADGDEASSSVDDDSFTESDDSSERYRGGTTEGHANDAEVAKTKHAVPDADVEDGMGERTCTHETLMTRAVTGEDMMSWAGTECSADWHVVRVDDRRTVRRQPPAGVTLPAGVEADDCDAYDEDGVHDALDSAFEYRAVWADGSYSWERRGWLLDAGYGREVAAVDAAKAPAKPTSTAGARPKKPSLWERRPKRHQYIMHMAKANGCVGPTPVAEAPKKPLKPPRLPNLIALRKSFERLLPATHARLLARALGCSDSNVGTALANRLVASMSSCGGEMERFAVTMPRTLAKCAARLDAADEVVLVYHGTRAGAVLPICLQGLCVPGSNGVTVANGSAFGVGIYAAEEPATPLCYARDGGLFVCVAVKTKDEKLAKYVLGCGYRIFFQDHLVVPLVALKVRQNWRAATGCAATGPVLVDCRPVQPTIIQALTTRKKTRFTAKR